MTTTTTMMMMMIAWMNFSQVQYPGEIKIKTEEFSRLVVVVIIVTWKSSQDIAVTFFSQYDYHNYTTHQLLLFSNTTS